MQIFPQISADGAGGAIIAWMDGRNGTDMDIYAQRVDGAGAPQWTANGIAISNATGDQIFPQLITDGAGGAIIVWHDARSGSNDVYAQRVDGAGVPLWTANGVAISSAAGQQWFPQLVSDGAGGAIIAWEDNRSGNWDVYAQRVDGTGAVQWTTDGIAISTATNDQGNSQLVSDGAGGAIIAWEDNRSGNWDVYAQRVDGTGAVQWTTDGIAISTATNDQRNPQLVADGAGGAIIVWQDARGGSYDIYAQRVDSTGAVAWATDGTFVSTALGDQVYPQLVADGSGGAIIMWQDNHGITDYDYDIYIQGISSAGNLHWSSWYGIAITYGAHTWYPRIIADGAGGAIVVWEELSGGVHTYAQRVDRFGAQWTAGGAAISTVANNQLYQQLAPDGAGGAIIVWSDTRNSGTNWDIYAQGITASGMLK